jgi:hypothetical protein
MCCTKVTELISFLPPLHSDTYDHNPALQESTQRGLMSELSCIAMLLLSKPWHACKVGCNASRSLLHCSMARWPCFCCPLQLISRPFEVAYHDWEGISEDPAEKASLKSSLATVPGCHTLMMWNHGAITMGRTVGEAFVLAYYLQRVCDTQLRILAAGVPIQRPNMAIMHKASQQIEEHFPAGLPSPSFSRRFNVLHEHNAAHYST